MNWKTIHRTALIRGLSLIGLGTNVAVRTDQKLAALTFDDGPHPEFTPKTLTLLEEYGAVGTFFLVGEYAEEHPGVVEKIVRGGHAIGNHTHNHFSFSQIRVKECRSQIRRCSLAVKPYETRLLRPPYGAQTIRSRLTALMLGYRVVTWSLHVDDWNSEDAVGMSDRLIEGIRPGSIILLHDGIYGRDHIDRTAMLDALRTLLQRTRNEYQYVTLPTLLKSGPVVRKAWYRRTTQVE